MRVFRPKYTKTNKAGVRKTHLSSIYHVTFLDAFSQARRRVAGYPDKAATRALGQKLERLAARRAVGEAHDVEILQWLDGIDPGLQTQLVEWNLIDSRTIYGRVSLEDHVKQWGQAILDEGRTRKHASSQRAYVDRVVAECGLRRFSDLDETTVTRYLATLGVAAETNNHYRRALKQFGKWMVRVGRASRSPLESLPLLDSRRDRRRQRRALTTDEVRRLIAAADAATDGRKMSGPERALVYLLAAHTGLRASELASLTRSSFDLDSEPATVKVQAAYAKNGRRDTLPLNPELVEPLRSHLASKMPGVAAFAMPNRAAEMLRADLERAGLPYRDEAGEYFDFHALRGQCATNLIRGGTHLINAQAIMRHGTQQMTERYERVPQSDKKAAAVAVQPSLAPDHWKLAHRA